MLWQPATAASTLELDNLRTTPLCLPTLAKKAIAATFSDFSKHVDFVKATFRLC